LVTVTLRDEVRDEEASDISGRVSGLIVAGGWWLTWATADGKEERLARLTAEKIEKLNSGQDAHNPTAKLPSNHTPMSGEIMCFPTETIRRVIEKFKAEFRTFPSIIPRVLVGSGSPKSRRKQPERTQ
jgi:hypothetical protein